MLIALGLIGLAAALFYGAIQLKKKIEDDRRNQPAPVVVLPDRLTGDVNDSAELPPPTAA